MDTGFITALEKIVGPEFVSANRPGRKVYSYDASLVEGMPGAVVFPGHSGEVAAIVRLAEASGIPYVPRGFGTNLSGGSIAPDGGLVIGLARFNRILDIQLENRRVVVQPGVPNLDLQNALAPFGFFYAPDPASQKVATLGGNAAENSGGPRCLKYGVTTNHILEMEVVLPGGETARLGGPNGDAPGGDLRGLFIGSEGTFGIVTELTVRILPLPEAVITMLVVYDGLDEAARTVSDIISAGIIPAALEMMDQPVMQAVEDSFPCGYPRDAAAVLIIEVEGPADGLETQAGHIDRICRQNNCREIRRAHNERERTALWAGRRGAFGAVARLAPRYLVADSTVPRTRLPEALEQVGRIVEQYGLTCGNVFHAGDGNLHPLILFDPKEPGQYERVHQAGREVMELCVALGGTITGEHGVGLEKQEGMRLVFSEDDLALMQDLKAAIDPAGRLNPGKIVPPDIEVKETVPFHDPGRFSPGALAPGSEEEAVDMVCWAGSTGNALRPVGTGRRADYGRRTSVELSTLSTRRLTRIHEYDPSNQVISAGAGVTIGTLQDILADHNQWLPLRAPLDAETTLGGVAALACFGPERLFHGAPRDLALGLQFISGRGRIIQAGGRVVKNVAGYDLTRLMIGSAGCLGLITRVTLKVTQRPQVCRGLVAEGPIDACRQAAEGLLRSKTQPAFLAAWPLSPGVWRFRAGFENLAETVESCLKTAREVLDRAGLASSVEDHPLREGPWADPYERIYRLPVVVRMDLPLNRLFDFTGSSPIPLDGSDLLWDMGSGRLLLGLTDLPEDIWSALARRAFQEGGYAVLEKAPESLKATTDVYGPKQSAWPLLGRIKKAMDPGNIFSPWQMPGVI